MLASVAFLLAALQSTPAPLSAEEKRELRALFTALVNEPDAGKRKSLSASGARFQEKHAFTDLVALVREGPDHPADPRAPRNLPGRLEKLATFDSVTVGFTFEHAGSTYRYAVDIPPSYDARKACGLLLDPGHGSGAKSGDKEKAGFLEMFRRHTQEAGHGDWLVARTEILEQIGADGVRKVEPEDLVAQVFGAFFRDMLTRFHVDLDRIYVTGVSQTGFWTWYLARERTDRFAGAAPMSAVTWEVDQALSNVSSLPLFVLHGSQDPVCPVAQPRATCARLMRLGAPVTYLEIEKGAHDYAVWSNLPKALKSLGEKARERYPRRVSRSVGTTLNPWCAWLRIDRIEKEGDGRAATKPTAGIDGEIEGQTVRLYSQGVKAATLALTSELVDLDRPVEILWNGKRVHPGKIEKSFATLLEIAGEKCDWLATFAAQVTLQAPSEPTGF